MRKYPTLFIALFTLLLFVFIVPHEVNAFALLGQYTEYEPAGLLSGIWHGLLAPWSLIARWFIDDVVMYAIPNTGWFYDFGFLVGAVFSIPIGWIFAIFSSVGHIFF
jgi:hypothetical protein